MKNLLKVVHNFLRRSYQFCQRPLHDLVQGLQGSSCRGPAKIPSALPDLVQVLVRSSWRDPVLLISSEVLAVRS